MDLLAVLGVSTEQNGSATMSDFGPPLEKLLGCVFAFAVVFVIALIVGAFLLGKWWH